MRFSRLLAVLLAGALFLTTSCGGKKEQVAPALDISVKEMEPVWFCYVDNRGPYEQIGARFGEIGGMAAQHRIGGHMMGLFFDDPDKVAPEECRSELGVQVPAGFEAPEGYKIKEIPAGRFATVTMTGPYQKIAKEYKKIFAWISRNDYQIAGPLMEVYLKGGPGVPPEEYLTEVRVRVM